MEHDVPTARAAWKSLPPAAGASQGWASFHSELKTLLQGWKNASWMVILCWYFVAFCCINSEELVSWDRKHIRQVRKRGLPRVCLAFHPPSVHFCQGLLEAFCKRNLGVILIPDLSSKKNWKQLGCTHSEFDVPFSTPVGSVSHKAPLKAGQSCWDRHNMHRELELSGCRCIRHAQHEESPPVPNHSHIPEEPQVTPQSSLASGILHLQTFRAQLPTISNTECS